MKSFMHFSGKERTILFARNKHFTPLVAWGLAVIIAIAAIVAAALLVKTHTTVPSILSSPMPPVASPSTVAQAPSAPKPGAVTVAKAQPSRPVFTNKKTVKRKSYLDESKARLSLSDPLEVIAKVAEDGNNEGVLLIFNDLPPDAATDPVARLFQLRALYALGKKQQVAEILNAPSEISDGEYYLIKAKVARDQGNIDQSLLLLDKALAVKARNLDAQTLHRDYLFCRAQCLTRRFDNAPTDPNRKDALDSWFEVNPTHDK